MTYKFNIQPVLRYTENSTMSMLPSLYRFQHYRLECDRDTMIEIKTDRVYSYIKEMKF